MVRFWHSIYICEIKEAYQSICDRLMSIYIKRKNNILVNDAII